MKPSLQLKLSQHLALTPQLQQSIRLLQLSTLELEQELEKYLQDNPLLEREEEEYAAQPAIAGISRSGNSASEKPSPRSCCAEPHQPTKTAGWAKKAAIRVPQARSTMTIPIDHDVQAATTSSARTSVLATRADEHPRIAIARWCNA